ncbi:hypothetical protein [Nocardia jejuensis]|uniref:hypothetical protein n=1 Tax=Nocardia jejuensis TaxID=328049 RepID=UPI00082AA5BD|nr:hypothetical protein [Nocardia jejuensis]
MDEMDPGGARAGTMPRPPFSAELLAELHAGLLPAHMSGQLWPAVRRDPEAMRYLQSLDGVNARLRDLGRDERIAHPMPAEVTARLERMIDELATADLTGAGEQATVHRLPVPPRSAAPTTAPMPALNVSIYDTGRLDPSDLEHLDFEPDTESEANDEPGSFPPRERPSRRFRWLAAAAATVAVVAGTLIAVDAVSGRTTGTTAHPAAETELAADLPKNVILSAMGHHELTGPLATGDALTDCLQAADLNRPLLGARSVTYSGQQAVLVLLAGPEPPQISAIVLGSGCLPGNPQVLATADIG